MKWDIFFSICQTEVEGFLPTERQMFENFFDQIRLADTLGFGTAWVAEVHLSCQVQKQNRNAVIRQFRGEIGLNTDIFQLGHLVFSQTRNLNVGSAVCNLICNGGPIARAESVKTFLTLHGLKPNENRKLEFGFAAGRFPFSNEAYGFHPRNDAEAVAWPVLKGQYFAQATEIFLRLLNGESLSSKDLNPIRIGREQFRTDEDFERALGAFQKRGDVQKGQIHIPPFWEFEKVGVIPQDYPQHLLQLTIGSHDPETQIMANRYRPVGVFNLSITPDEKIQETHHRMERHYQGEWKRELMPRTAMVFVDGTAGLSEEAQTQRAHLAAKRAWENYWKAMEGTLDPVKVAQAVGNALVGSPQEIARQIRQRYHPDDRLMLWFDFNNHDHNQIKEMMRLFIEEVVPLLEPRSRLKGRADACECV